VVIPIAAGGGPVIGVLSFDDLQTDRKWPQETVDRLNLIAQVFTNALTRKRSEIELRESQTRLKTATEAAGIGLWIMDPDTTNIWVTPQVRALFNFEKDEVLNYNSFNRMIVASDRERVNRAVQASLASGKNLLIEFRVADAHGGVRWIHVRGKRLLEPLRNKVRLMGASVDVSQRKLMEKQLQDQLEEITNLKQQLEKDNINLRKEIDLQHVHEDIVGRSQAMQHILGQVEQVAQTDATVLIEGETGTGKELLARTVHRLSDRKNRPMVTVNCASLPPTLVESELYGREKGAYTGALTRMTGRFETADGATIFLDEVGELPLDVQAKLLRVLEQGTFERLGSTQSMQVDVRVIAATNQELSRLSETGGFRKDLYYRLNVFPIHISPLRERPEDIPPLVWHFVRQFEHKMGRRIDHIPRSDMNELMGYAWPGNVRELKNLIERAMIVCNSRTLKVHPPIGNNVALLQAQTLEEAERRHLMSVLERTGWRLSGPRGAAGILGLKRTTLQSKLKKLGIMRPKSA
jgi:PAS domain S-box-containing protein